jgi:hypothetical protein
MNLIEQKGNRLGMAALLCLACIGRLRKNIVVRRGDASGNLEVAPPHRAQEAIEQAGAQLRIAICSRNAQQAHLWRAQGQRQRKGVVNVIANIGVQQH